MPRQSGSVLELKMPTKMKLESHISHFTTQSSTVSILILHPELKFKVSVNVKFLI